MKKSVKSVKGFVDAVNGSTRWDKFKQIQERKIVEGLLEIKMPMRIISDVDTRSNSTYLLIQRVLLLRPAVEKARADMGELQDCASLYWPALNNLLAFLKPFYEDTEKISGSKCYSISLITRLVPRLEIHAAQAWTDKNVERAAAIFRDKLVSYKSHLITDITLIAPALDPRLKLRGSDKASRSLIKIKMNNFVSTLSEEEDILSQDAST